MSVLRLFTAGLACMTTFAAAYTKPTGDAPKGNPISQPGLNSVVPAGKQFTITWEPTTKGTVTLVLLKGPSSNAVPQYPIVEKTENDGTYVWNVADNLEPTENAQGYGIQLIDDATGQYQYTTQFGVSNPDYKEGSEEKTSSASAPSYGQKTSSSSAMEHATSSAPSYGHKTTAAPAYTTQYVTDYTTYCPEATSFAINNKTYTVTQATTLTIKDCSCTITKALSTSAPVSKPTVAPGPVSPPKGTGYPVMSSPAQNVTMVAPTGYSPSTMKTATASTYNSPSGPSATSSGPSVPVSTGGAASNFAGLSGLILVAGAAVLAL